jgi:hypothetical protein
MRQSPGVLHSQKLHQPSPPSSPLAHDAGPPDALTGRLALILQITPSSNRFTAHSTSLQACPARGYTSAPVGLEVVFTYIQPLSTQHWAANSTKSAMGLSAPCPVGRRLAAASRPRARAGRLERYLCTNVSLYYRDEVAPSSPQVATEPLATVQPKASSPDSNESQPQGSSRQLHSPSCSASYGPPQRTLCT